MELFNTVTELLKAATRLLNNAADLVDATNLPDARSLAFPHPSEPHRHQIHIYDDPQWKSITTNVSFIFLSSWIPPDNALKDGIQWEARLRVKTRDLPRLMREGFHWGPANFCPDSYIDANLQEPALTECGWTCSRNYYLSDLRDEKNALWAAKLVVCARDLRVLSQFQVADLQPRMIYHAFAWNLRVSPYFLYDFDRDFPDESSNRIYENMPLDGWWPWPKREQQLIEGKMTDEEVAEAGGC